MLHDVGKIGVPDRILRMPGKLSVAEFETVKQHAGMGALLVGSALGLQNVMDAVRHHHERWDGAGYPAGLQAEAIPLAARIIAVADAYSAMISNRPYRRGLSAKEAQEILQRGGASQWDANCVRIFSATIT